FAGIGSTIDTVAGDRAVVAGRSPVQDESGQRVLLMPFRMLLPVRIAVIDPVRSVKILTFDGFKKLADHALVGTKAIEKGNNREEREKNPTVGRGHSPSRRCPEPSSRPGIVFFRIHQSHATFLQRVRLKSKVERAKVANANTPRYSRSGQIAAKPTPFSK